MEEFNTNYNFNSPSHAKVELCDGNKKKGSAAHKPIFTSIGRYGNSIMQSIQNLEVYDFKHHIAIGTGMELREANANLKLFVRNQEGQRYLPIDDEVIDFFLGVGPVESTYVLMYANNCPTATHILPQLLSRIKLRGSSFVVFNSPIASIVKKQVGVPSNE